MSHRLRALLASAFYVLSASVAFAAGPVVITTVPSTSTAPLGTQFDVVLQVQAGAQQVSVAEADLNFDATKLQVVSITAGSTLPNTAANNFNNTTGQTNFAAFAFSGFPTGTFTLCTVRFTSIATTAGTTLAFNSTNPRKTDAVLGGSSVLASAIDGNVVITTAASPTPTASAAATQTRTRTPTPPPDPTDAYAVCPIGQPCVIPVRPFNLGEIPSFDPSTGGLREGDFWCTDGSGGHRCCFYNDGQKRCANFDVVS